MCLYALITFDDSIFADQEQTAVIAPPPSPIDSVLELSSDGSFDTADLNKASPVPPSQPSLVEKVVTETAVAEPAENKGTDEDDNTPPRKYI